MSNNEVVWPDGAFKSMIEAKGYRLIGDPALLAALKQANPLAATWQDISPRGSSRAAFLDSLPKVEKAAAERPAYQPMPSDIEVLLAEIEARQQPDMDLIAAKRAALAHTRGHTATPPTTPTAPAQRRRRRTAAEILNSPAGKVFR